MSNKVLKTCVYLACICFANPIYCADESFSADFLLWQVRAGSAENWTQQISASGTNQPIKVFSIPFKLSPGVRIGISSDMQHDLWDVNLFYTWYQSKASASATATSGGMYSPYLGNFFVNNTAGNNFGPNYRSASAAWNLYYNVIDLELGRKFTAHQSLILRPFIGLKLASINQSINTTWQSPTVATTFSTATEDLKNNFWGVGPAFGIDSQWIISKRYNSTFNIIANVAGALMYGHWNFKDVYQNNTPSTKTVHVNNINGAASMIDGTLGVEWKKSIAARQLSLRLSYEAQVWFDQMQYYSFNMGRLNNILSLQGVALSFVLDLN